MGGQVAKCTSLTQILISILKTSVTSYLMGLKFDFADIARNTKHR